MAGHRGGLWQAEEVQQGRSDVGEAAIVKMPDRSRRVGHDKRYRVQRMRGMRLAAFVIKHHFGVAMIGGNDERATNALDRLRKPAEAGVDGLDSLDCRAEIAGMPDHIGIGVVEYDDVETAGFDRFNYLFRYFGRGHFGLLVVSRDLW